MNHLIIGYGEVGQALHTIFPKARTMDVPKGILFTPTAEGVDVIHICFPYSEKFCEEVKKYQKDFYPKLTIIHSSVPIGTSDSLNAVHSPVRGVHPKLELGLKTFIKYFGGFKAHEAAMLFVEAGINSHVIRDARTTEALKLWDTTQYGIMILLEKEIYKFCRENGVDFEVVYADANRTYHDGYKQLGMSYVTRPTLFHKEGKIGGHCVVENAALLDTPLAKLIIETNKKL